MAFLITTSASSILKACGKQGIRTLVTLRLTCLVNRRDKPLCQLSMFPCSSEHGILFLFIFIYCRTPTEWWFKSHTYYSDIPLQVHYDRSVLRLLHKAFRLHLDRHQLSICYVYQFFRWHDWNLANHTAYIILYCSSYRIRTGDLRNENQLTFKHETNNKMKRAALPLS